MIEEERWNNFWKEHGLDNGWESGIEPNLQEFLKINNPKTALDIGCGSGINSQYMENLGIIVDAIDISENALLYTKDKKNINFIKGNFIEHTILKSYDFVYDRGCFHYYINNESFIKKIVKVLNPGGKWLSIIGSNYDRNDGKAGGPPGFLSGDIIKSIENHLKIQSLIQTKIINSDNSLCSAWAIISYK